MAADAIGDLRRAQAVLRASNDPAALRIADAIDRYQRDAAGGARLDATLRLTQTSGGGPWWRREAIQRRNQALRELVSLLKPATPAEAVRRVTHAVTQRTTSRAAPRSQAEQLADAVLRSGARMPDMKQLRNVLEIGSPGEFPCPDFQRNGVGSGDD